MFQRLSATRLVAFVSPEMAMAAFIVPLVAFIPAFYAGEMGLGLGTVGLIFGLTKLWDVATDPIIGVISDRIRTPFGRRRPMFVISLPLLMFCTYKIFMPPEQVGASYFAIWMVCLFVAWTLITLSHITWAVELSPDYHERSRIAGFKQGAGLIGTLCAIFIPVMIDQMSNPGEGDRVAGIGLFIIVMLPITGIAALWAAKEPSVDELQPSMEGHNSLKDIWAAVRGNRPLRMLLGANMLLGMAGAACTGTVLFLVERVLDLGRWATFAMVPLMLAGLVSLPGWITLSRRIGKHKAFTRSMAYLIIVFPFMIFLPVGNLWICLIAFMFIGVYNGIITFLPQTMMADITDIETAETGDRRSGLYIALLQTSSKLAGALGIASAYGLLAAIGFDADPDAVNTEQALFGVKALFSLLPVAFFGLAWFVMRNYPLDEEHQLQLRKKIDAQTHADPDIEAVVAETRSV